MTTTINADNGVVSGSAGLKYSSDSSGVLALQTNGTTAVTVDASQNVTLAGTLTTTGVTTFQAGTAALPSITTTGDTNTGIFFPAADTIAFSEGGVEAARIDSSGNLLVGTTTPVFNAAGRGLITINGSSAAALGFTAGAVDKGIILHTGTDMIMSNSVSGAMTFQTNNTERARIDSSGNVGIGMTPVASYGLLQVGSAVTSALGVSGLQGYVAGTNSALGQNGNMSIVTTNAQAVDIGGSIGLGGKFVAAGTSVLFAQISGRKENSTDNNSAGYLQFATQPNGGTPTERMRIDSSGNVFVGGTTQNTSTKPVYASNTAKAWVSFGGTGAINGSAFNVSSVTRISTGNFEVNFSSAMPNTNFVATANSWQSASNSGVAYNVISFTTAKYQISTYENNALTNPTAVYSIVFGT